MVLVRQLVLVLASCRAAAAELPADPPQSPHLKGRRAQPASVLEEQAQGFLAGSSGLWSTAGIENQAELEEELGDDWDKDWEADLERDDDDEIADTLEGYQQASNRHEPGAAFNANGTLPHLEEADEFDRDFPEDDDYVEDIVSKPRSAKLRSLSKAEQIRMAETAVKKAQQALQKANDEASLVAKKTHPLAEDFKEKHKVMAQTHEAYEKASNRAAQIAETKHKLAQKAEEAMAIARVAAEEFRRIQRVLVDEQKKVKQLRSAETNSTDEARDARMRLDKKLAILEEKQKKVKQGLMELRLAEDTVNELEPKKNQGGAPVVVPSILVLGVLTLLGAEL